MSKNKSAPVSFERQSQGANDNEADNSTTITPYTIPAGKAIDIIRGFAGQGNTITLSRAFLRLTGHLPSALLLSQLVFWCDKGVDPAGWIYKTYDAWQDEIGLSRDQAMRAKRRLESLQLIKTTVKKANGNPTVHYRVLEHNLLKSLVSEETPLSKVGKPHYRSGGFPKNDSGVSQRTYNRPNIIPNTDDIHPSDISSSPPTGITYPPAQTDQEAEALAHQVMTAQHTKLTGPDRDRYRRALVIKAKKGNLEIPVGQQLASKQQAARAVDMARQKHEQQEADQLRKQQAEAMAEFDRLPKPEQQSWIDQVVETIPPNIRSWLAKPHLIRRQAAMSAAA